MISSISVLFQGNPHTQVSMVYGRKHWTELLGGPWDGILWFFIVSFLDFLVVAVVYQHTTKTSICFCYRSSLPLKTSRLWNPCGTWFIPAQGLRRHNLRYPRLSQCESWGKKKRGHHVWNLDRSQFLDHSRFLFKALTWKTSLQDLSDFTKKWGRYHMEKSLDLWTWLSEQGEMLSKDGNVHSEN